MKILLLYALKAEAHLIKQNFPLAIKSETESGLKFLALDERFDLLKTGVGLVQTQKAIERIPNPSLYGGIIQFGVSGSLSDEVGIHDLLVGQNFSARDQKTISLNPTPFVKSEKLEAVTFFSSTEMVTNETLRDEAASSGAQVVDMESYIVAEFCQRHGVRLQTIRCISDRAGSTTDSDFKENFGQASDKLQKYLLKHLLKNKRISP